MTKLSLHTILYWHVGQQPQHMPRKYSTSKNIEKKKNTISKMAHLVRPQNKQLKFLFQIQEYLMTYFSYENITNVNNMSFL